MAYFQLYKIDDLEECTISNEIVFFRTKDKKYHLVPMAEDKPWGEWLNADGSKIAPLRGPEDLCIINKNENFNTHWWVDSIRVLNRLIGRAANLKGMELEKNNEDSNE